MSVSDLKNHKITIGTLIVLIPLAVALLAASRYVDAKADSAQTAAEAAAEKALTSHIAASEREHARLEAGLAASETRHERMQEQVSEIHTTTQVLLNEVRAMRRENRR